MLKYIAIQEKGENKMYDDLKKKLYFKKVTLLELWGESHDKIVPFDDEFYEKLSHTFITSVPISIHIKYFKPKSFPGHCYERSLFMFFCFDDALLVEADTKLLEYKYGKGNGKHCWIEIGNYVYDPTLLKRFEKNIYYKILCPFNIYKTNKEEYRKLNGFRYDSIRSVTLKDFQPGGSKRTDLCMHIPFFCAIASFPGYENLKKELEEYLEKIQFDDKEIFKELAPECFTKRK